MLETDDLLVKCPRCGAWPMAVGSQKNAFLQREITFRCSRCGSDEAGRFRQAMPPGHAHRRVDAA